MYSITKKIKGAKSIILALLVFVLMANVVFAQGGRRLRERFGTGNEAKQERFELKQERLRQKLGKNLNGFGGGMQARVWARALRLTDEQIVRMRQIMRISGENYIALQKQMQEKRFQLERITFSDTVNEETLKQMAIEVGKLEGQMTFLRAKVQVQIRNILTPEQLKTYNELRFGVDPDSDLPEKNSEPATEQKHNNQ